MNAASSASPRFPTLGLLAWCTARPPREGGSSMDIVVERCAGLDVHKDLVVACVRYPGPDGERETEIASFSAFTSRPARPSRLAGVPRGHPGGDGGDRGLLEARPLCARRRLECWLLNARHMRNVPGRRPTSVTPSGSASSPSTASCARASSHHQRSETIRELTRYRRTVIEERAREAQRLDKVLQDAGVKLSSVASDVLGARAGRCSLALSGAPGSRSARRARQGQACARSCRSCALLSRGASDPPWRSSSRRSSPTSTTLDEAMGRLDLGDRGGDRPFC